MFSLSYHKIHHRPNDDDFFRYRLSILLCLATDFVYITHALYLWENKYLYKNCISIRLVLNWSNLLLLYKWTLEGYMSFKFSKIFLKNSVFPKFQIARHKTVGTILDEREVVEAVYISWFPEFLAFVAACIFNKWYGCKTWSK